MIHNDTMQVASTSTNTTLSNANTNSNSNSNTTSDSNIQFTVILRSYLDILYANMLTVKLLLLLLNPKTAELILKN